MGERIHPTTHLPFIVTDAVFADGLKYLSFFQFAEMAFSNGCLVGM